MFDFSLEIAIDPGIDIEDLPYAMCLLEVCMYGIFCVWHVTSRF